MSKGRSRRAAGSAVSQALLLLLATFALAQTTLRPARAVADEPTVVPCDGFLLGYDGPVKQRQCLIADVHDGTQTMKTHQMMLVDHAFFVLVNYIESGFKTYLPIRKLDEIAQDSRLFSETGDWLEPRRILGLEVAVFNGILKGRQYPDVCAIFSRYSGDPGNQYDSTLGPAFKNHVVGYYCAVPASLTPEQRGEAFYAIVREVIAKLRLPAAE